MCVTVRALLFPLFHLSLHVPKEEVKDKKGRKGELEQRRDTKETQSFLIPKRSLSFHGGLGRRES